MFNPHLCLSVLTIMALENNQGDEQGSYDNVMSTRTDDDLFKKETALDVHGDGDGDLWTYYEAAAGRLVVDPQCVV